MKKEKLFITDLDGTFVKDSVNVKEVDKQAIKEVQKKMKIGIATGRSNKEIEHIEQITGINFDYHIGFNGAVVKKNDEIIYDKKISAKLLKEVLDYIEKNDLVFDVLTGEDRIGTHQPKDTASLWNLTILNPSDLGKDLTEMDIYKVNLRPSKEFLNDILTELKNKYTDLSICKSGDSRIEITSKNVTKGNAIKLLKEKYDYNVISIGDSGNDVTMFEESDLSFCMAHASNDIKKYATQVVEHFYQAQENV